MLFAHTNCTVRSVKNLDGESFLRAPKRSSLHQTVDQQPLFRQTTETALGLSIRFAIEAFIYRKNVYYLEMHFCTQGCSQLGHLKCLYRTVEAHKCTITAQERKRLDTWSLQGHRKHKRDARVCSLPPFTEIDHSITHNKCTSPGKPLGICDPQCWIIHVVETDHEVSNWASLIPMQDLPTKEIKTHGYEAKVANWLLPWGCGLSSQCLGDAV